MSLLVSKLRAGILLALLILLGARPAPAQTLTIRFLDVGQGDATLIVSPEGKRVLIDAGPGESAVGQWLGTAHVDTIDLAIASHNHADHIGGMAAVLTAIPVRYYLDNGVPHTTATYQRTIAAVEARGAQYLRPTARTITVGTARFRILPPPPGAEDRNNHSVGVLVEFGEFRALLTGDSELGELGYWLEQDSVPQVQVVKVAHHGSANGTSIAWVQRTRPQIAVISVGAEFVRPPVRRGRGVVGERRRPGAPHRPARHGGDRRSPRRNVHRVDRRPRSPCHGGDAERPTDLTLVL